METKNPRTGSRGAGASVSIAADTETPNKTRPKLQANRAAKVRLANLLLARRWGVSLD